MSFSISNGFRSFFCCCQPRQRTVFDFLYNDDTELAKSLIRANRNLIYSTHPITGYSPLKLALLLNQKDVVELILDLDSNLANISDANDYNRLPLHRACIKDDVEIVKLILPHTRDVNAFDSLLVNPLLEACNKRSFEIVELLIKNGAKVDIKTNISNRTILHHAIQSSWVNVAKMLVRYGANVNAQDDNGDTPLHAACSLDNLELSEMLIHRGARLDVKNTSGQTPKDLAGPNTLTILNTETESGDA